MQTSLPAFLFDFAVSPKEHDLNRVVSEFGKRVTGSGVEIRFELFNKDLNVMVDAVKLHDVFTILVNNALDAMPAGGVLTIGTHRAVTGSGKYGTFYVADTGFGMDDITLQKVYEPFFTTKERNRGLGIPMAARIIEGHNGNITVQSMPGGGTKVSVHFSLLKENTPSEIPIPLPSSFAMLYTPGFMEARKPEGSLMLSEKAAVFKGVQDDVPGPCHHR